eukprot:4276678-Pyramimonas_sp.AAC.1
MVSRSTRSPRMVRHSSARLHTDRPMPTRVSSMRRWYACVSVTPSEQASEQVGNRKVSERVGK